MLGLDVTFQETQFYKDVKSEGKIEGKIEERRSIVSTLLDRKLGEIPAKIKKSIAALDTVKLESLTIALLDFKTIADLETWLKQGLGLIFHKNIRFINFF